MILVSANGTVLSFVQADRDLCMRLLLRVKGVVSVTFDVGKRQCLLRTRPDVKPEVSHQCAETEGRVGQGLHSEPVNMKSISIPYFCVSAKTAGPEGELRVGLHGADTNRFIQTCES